MIDEKQIEEIAKILMEAAHMACEDIPFAPPNNYDPCNLKVECHRCKEARALIAAGYRKQKVGEWIMQGDGTYYCSNCGNDATYTYDGTEIRGITCPFCGAWMKGEKEDG